MAKDDKARVLVGPPRRGGEVANPRVPDALMPTVMLIVSHLLPVLLGGGLGVLEGLARSGRANWWKAIDDYVKGSVMAIIAGVAAFFEAESDDAELRALCAHLFGAASALGAMYVLQKALSSRDVHQDGAPCPDGKSWDDKAKACAGLGSLAALSAQDARDVEHAVQELVRRRAEMADRVRSVDTSGLGEIPVYPLGEIPIEPVHL